MTHPSHNHTTRSKPHHSGVYYWQRASREDTVQVKLETPDDETTTEIVAVGNVRGLVGMRSIFEVLCVHVWKGACVGRGDVRAWVVGMDWLRVA